MNKLLALTSAFTLTLAPLAAVAQQGVAIQDPTTGQRAPVSGTNGLSVHCTTGCGAGSGGTVTVYGPTANGSPAANPPVLLGGTANGTGTGNVENVYVDASGFLHTYVTNWPAAQIVTPTGNPTTNGSTTITVGGTAQNLFSGATPAHGYMVCSPNLSDDLWVSDTTTALANGTGSFRVQANGGCFVTPPNSQAISAVSVVGPTTGDKITARTW